MTTQTRWMKTRLTMMLAGAALGCAGLTAAVSAAAPLEYSYSFYKQPITMLLDTSRIAVFEQNANAIDPGQRQAQVADLADRLAPVGIDGEGLEPHAVRGWTYASIPAIERAADPQAQAEWRVAQLASSELVDFVSPVFVDEYGPRIVTRDILIGFHDEITEIEANTLLVKMGVGEVIERNADGQWNVYRVRSSSRNGFEVLAKSNDIAQQPEVKFSEPDMIFTVKTLLTPNDPFFGSLWGIRQANDIDMDGDLAWDITIGSSSIKTAVFDTGTQSAHPDLNAVSGFDVTGQGPNGEPGTTCDNHGTQVAGCIAARINNSIGVVGIAPGTIVAGFKTLTIPAANPCGLSGSGGNFSFAISLAQSNGFRVTNTSLGFGASGTVDNAFTNARNAGLVHFAASGNESSGTIGYPSSSPSVNSVGAISQNGARASFSNFGTGLDFSAPGNGILTTDRTGTAGDSSTDYVTTSGTSFASPYAAGVAALVLSKNSFLTAAQVESIMQTSSTDLGAAGYDTTFGWGLVNARSALDITPTAAAPGPFSISAPANGATQQPLRPGFSWTTSNFATNYLLEVDNNADFSSPEVSENTTLTNLPQTPMPLAAATTYFVRITASNTLGSSVATPAGHSFRTYDMVPGPFSLQNPANAATSLPLQPTLDWSGSALADSFTVTIDNDSNFSSPLYVQNVTSQAFFVPIPLAPLTTYFWTVSANNAIGSTVGSPASRSFTTGNDVPGPFNLLSPADGVDVGTRTPTLDWSNAAGSGITYTLVVDDQQNFSSPAVNTSGLVNSTYTFAQGVLSNFTRYYWKVTAVNAAGQTASTPAVFSFAVVATNCLGDADRNGSVTFGDVTTVLSNFGTTGPQGDADYNNIVNFADITTVLSNFQLPCP